MPFGSIIFDLKAMVGQVVGAAPAMTLMEVSKLRVQIAIEETNLSEVEMVYQLLHQERKTGFEKYYAEAHVFLSFSEL